MWIGTCKYMPFILVHYLGIHDHLKNNDIIQNELRSNISGGVTYGEEDK
jgi:hypothetical protein